MSAKPKADGDEIIELTPTVEIAFHRGTAGGDDPTFDFALGGAPEGGGHVELVAGAARTIGTETTSLLHSRLRTVSFVMLVIFSMTLVWSIVNEAAFDTGALRLITGVNIARIALLGGILGVLWSRPHFSNRFLRGLEYALFGGLIVSWMAVRYQSILSNARDGVMVDLVLEAQLQMFALFVYMILHGLFIPHRWTGTARVVGTMALAPVVTLAALKLVHPELVERIAPITSERTLSTDLLIVAVGVFLATYGAAMFDRMRAQVHEAKKFGQYQLVRKIGAGGMGEVHLAEHALLKRPCALKLIRTDAAGDPTALARFEREVQTTARLTHPNTIEIFDYGHTDDGTFYYVMEFLPGMSSAELVEQHGPLPPGRVVYLLRQACSALAEAHAEGLIHRDLKPANVYISERGGLCDFVKILDFGLVKLTHEPDAAQLTADMTVSGTPLYMSPEQATGERGLDPRSDLYALGAIAYTWLTGRPPFEGSTPVQVMIAHARDPVTPPSTHRPEVPQDLEQVILRCLAKAPADRFADASEMEQALASCAVAADWDHRQAALWWHEVMLGQPAPADA
ncbi:serine/threonine-protein kinase [Tautonia sp. JC769]|uniref:serine/threonine-protein kinase n=1 Tax=Tautonia sp. JC769 TaxID=3232135 RepID=UPI0034581157